MQTNDTVIYSWRCGVMGGTQINYYPPPLFHTDNPKEEHLLVCFCLFVNSSVSLSILWNVIAFSFKGKSYVQEIGYKASTNKIVQFLFKPFWLDKMSKHVCIIYIYIVQCIFRDMSNNKIGSINSSIFTGLPKLQKL